eukprot:scaffold4368_cov180-Ochromonas_danica.AAC.19
MNDGGSRAGLRADANPPHTDRQTGRQTGRQTATRGNVRPPHHVDHACVLLFCSAGLGLFAVLLLRGNVTVQ